MKKFSLLVLISLFYSSVQGAAACEIPQGNVFPSLNTAKGAVVFELAPVENDPADADTADQMGIDVYYLECGSGSTSLIGQLPYLAATGAVAAAFFADTGFGSRLFIIHSVEIRSDTGVKYSGNYFSVHAYQNTGAVFVRDEKLSSYFGEGADIFADNYNDLAYVFPYKTALSISAKLKSQSYTSWRSAQQVTLTINKKTFLHTSPVLSDITGRYLIAGDRVQQEGVEAGWLSIAYHASSGKVIKGWIKCGNADGC